MIAALQYIIISLLYWDNPQKKYAEWLRVFAAQLEGKDPFYPLYQNLHMMANDVENGYIVFYTEERK